MTQSVSVRGETCGHPEPEDAIEATRIALCAELDLVACWFESWPFGSLLPRIEHGRVVLPGDVVGARSFAEWEPGDGIELPVRVEGFRLGRFVLVPRCATVGVALPASARDRAIELAARINRGVLQCKT